IRSDIYDYGVYLRLRYQTRVKDRVEISYLLQKRVFNAVRNTPSVDFAIPFIYSYRAGVERKEEAAPFPELATQPDKEAGRIRQIPAEKVHISGEPPEAQDIEQVASSVAALGLLQPIVVVRRPGAADEYDLLAGHLRLAACKKLGWKTIPAVVVDTHQGMK
ncbi:MAG: ParB N-terminal domain-containing protein, partial [Planctomycetota bacterium]|nr:ParB N-terminal domain-containing protein [Planctomycetota bacterium]